MQTSVPGVDDKPNDHSFAKYLVARGYVADVERLQHQRGLLAVEVMRLEGLRRVGAARELEPLWLCVTLPRPPDTQTSQLLYQ